MRPWAGAPLDGLLVAVLRGDSAAGEAWSDDFLRGGNLLSLAAEKRLEVDAQVFKDVLRSSDGTQQQLLRLSVFRIEVELNYTARALFR